MNGTIVDDRIAKGCLETHTVLVCALDRGMSGWGKASGGKSRCAWACEPQYANQVADWVEDRSDMSEVTIVDEPGHFPLDYAHFHIYVVSEGHPALQ